MTDKTISAWPLQDRGRVVHRQRAGGQHSTVTALASLEGNTQCWTFEKAPPVHRAGTTVATQPSLSIRETTEVTGLP